MQLDHIAIAGETLAEAIEYVEGALGVKLSAGGEHDVFYTHNALLGLEDGLYLEAISINPDAPTPARPRWFNLDHFAGKPRLTNWICASSNIDAELASLPKEMGAPVSLVRGDLRWRMAVPDTGILPFDNCAPALIQWQTGTHPALRLASSGVRLRRLTVRHPNAEQIQLMVSPLLHDDRVAFETGSVGMEARFETPFGDRMLVG